METFDKTNALKTLLDNNHVHPCRKINATSNKRRLVQTKIPALLHDLLSQFYILSFRLIATMIRKRWIRAENGRKMGGSEDKGSVEVPYRPRSKPKTDQDISW